MCNSHKSVPRVLYGRLIRLTMLFFKSLKILVIILYTAGYLIRTVITRHPKQLDLHLQLIEFVALNQKKTKWIAFLELSSVFRTFPATLIPSKMMFHFLRVL